MRKFTVAAVKLLDLELVHLYNSDSESREIRAASSGVGARVGWIAVVWRRPRWRGVRRWRLESNISRARLSVAKADGQSDQMQIFDNGALVKTMKISLGSAQFPTHTGAHVVSDKQPSWSRTPRPTASARANRATTGRRCCSTSASPTTALVHSAHGR